MVCGAPSRVVLHCVGASSAATSLSPHACVRAHVRARTPLGTDPPPPPPTPFFSLTHLTHSLARFLTNSFPHSLTHLLTHSLTSPRTRPTHPAQRKRRKRNERGWSWTLLGGSRPTGQLGACGGRRRQGLPGGLAGFVWRGLGGGGNRNAAPSQRPGQKRKGAQQLRY